MPDPVSDYLSDTVRKPQCETASSYSLTEGVDFNWEGERMVFTKHFHLRRGYCCGSGCRECPYEVQAFSEAPAAPGD